MADEQARTAEQAPARRPTTIDLKATEIASEPVNPTEPVDPAQKSGVPRRPRSAAAKPARRNPPPPPAERPRSGGWRERIDLSGAERAHGGAARPGRGARELARRLRRRRRGGGHAGAVARALGGRRVHARDDRRHSRRGSPAWNSSVRDSPTGRSRRRSIQRALADLAARVGAAEQAMGRLADLDARLAKAEAAASAAARSAARAQPRSGARPRASRRSKPRCGRSPISRQRLDAANAAARDAKSRADAAFEAAQKTPRAGRPRWPPAEIEALTARVAALEQAAKALRRNASRVTAGADRAGRLAFVAVALRAAVERGEPFAQELAAAKPLVPDAAALGAARAVRRDRRAARRRARARALAAHRLRCSMPRAARRARAASSTACSRMPSGWCASARSTRRRATMPRR